MISTYGWWGFFLLHVAHFTGKTDIGAPKKKKKCKKKHAKERHTDEKTNLSKPKTLDKSSVTGKPSGPKDDSRNGSITQTSKGTEFCMWFIPQMTNYWHWF